MCYGSHFCASVFTINTSVFVVLQGWYIVTYALGIYHLNLFIAFLSPKVDPSLLDEGTTTLDWGSSRVEVFVDLTAGLFATSCYPSTLSASPLLPPLADEGPALPTKQNEEFRPFIRRLPEFKFWSV